MRVAFLVFNLDGMGGTSRSAITQANALADLGHDVQLVSVTRSADHPHYRIDPRVRSSYCLDGVVDDADGPSRLVPRHWDAQFSARTDAPVREALAALEVDVLVTVTPALLALAVQLAPPGTAVVHQEHRSTSDRTAGLEPLLAFAPRAAVVASLTPTMAEWLREQLGETAPEIVVMPNPLPVGFTPRSRLDQPLIVSAGRLVREKQWHRLVIAFGQVADRLPGWRLRIFGDGPQRAPLMRQARRLGLYDRVELPGSCDDLRGEWAKASVCALTSRAEGLPLVVQEAMAAGVPAASFDCASGPRELIEHEVSGLLVTPDSNPAMAAALLRLGTDVELRHRLGAAALAASAQYDAGLIAARWVEIFERALAGSVVPAPRVPQDAPERVVRHTTPQESRREALDVVTAAARATEGPWWVLPPHERLTATVVVPADARTTFLDHLAGPDHLSVAEPRAFGWPGRRSTLTAGVAHLRRGVTPYLTVEPWPRDPDGTPALLGHGCGVDVEFWPADPDGELGLPKRNAWTRRIPLDAPTVETEVEGLTVPVLALAAEPTVLDVRFPVDAVWTWVDGDDPAWNDAREQRLADLTGTPLTRESSGRARFVSRDELRWSMRSVHLFAPWVRHLYVVTAGQVPAWLDRDHPQVTVVDHRDLLPPDALPTFNSQAIETGLHRIEGLSEQFVYLNDDVFLGRPLTPQAFFTGAGAPRVFLDDASVGLGDRSDTPPYLKAGLNNRRLLRERFGATITSVLAHTPHALTRGLLAEVERLFPAEYAATGRSPFRADTDLAVPSSLAGHVGLATGRAVVGEPARAYVDLGSRDVGRRLGLLRDRDQDFFCLGDQHDLALDEGQLEGLLTEFLDGYFPVAAPWELTPRPAGP